MSRTERSRSAAWMRWALLATTLATGAALLAASWSAWSTARGAAETVTRGQGEALLQSLRRHVSEERRLSTDVDLSTFLDAEAAGGLRHVALLSPRGEVRATAGDALANRLPGERLRRRPGFVLEDLGERVRLVAGAPRERRPPGPPAPPPPRPRRPRPGERDPFPPQQGLRPGPAPSSPWRRGEEGGDASPWERRPPAGEPRPEPPDVLVLEFEPLLARELARQSTRALGLGGLAAGALLAGAAILWRLSVQREEAARRLAERERLSSLGEMSAVLAHEIKNPLASLKGHAQLLAERLPEGGRERQGAERVVTEARRLERLAGRLLDFVRSGRVEREERDPAALVREAVASVIGHPVRVTVDAGSAPDRWSLDPIRMREVVVNLLENALQAGDGPVAVRLARTGPRLVLEVADRGPGLPSGEEERVFEPFHTTRATGTGLGLAVARRVVELHGGTIRAQNREGGGAVFRVEIP